MTGVPERCTRLSARNVAMKTPFRSSPVATAPYTAAIASAGRAAALAAVAAVAAVADATKPNFKGTAKRPFAHKVKSNKNTPVAGYR